jgi:hypothetical protein
VISCLFIGTGLVLDPSGSQQYDILPHFKLSHSSLKKERKLSVLQQNFTYGGLDINLNVVIRHGYTVSVGNLLESDHLKDRTGGRHYGNR